jgi:hypothetical protein
MAKGGHVACTELLAQPIVGRGVEPLVAVEMAVHESDAMAYGAVAFMIGKVDDRVEHPLE